MEAISATDMSSFLEETTPGMTAARRRMAEVRRLKMVSSSGNYAEFVKKRTRSRNGSRFCSTCFSEEPAHTDSDNSKAAMEIEIQSQALYPARRLVRSVSTPIAWKGGLFCTCNFDNYFNKQTNAKQNSENLKKTDNPNNNNNNSSESEKDPNNSSVMAKSETKVEGSSPEKAVNKTGCEEPQEKTVLVDVANKVLTPSIPPLPAPSLLSSSSSSSSTNSIDSASGSGSTAKGRHGERGSVVPASRPLKGINRAYSESISHLLKDPCPPHGTMSIIGRRREMEDAVAAVPSFFSLPKSNTDAIVQNGISGFTTPSPTSLHFFAVYDGHGGSQASIFCKNRFHEALAEELSNASPFTRDLNDWTKVMSACFMKMDIAVGGICPSGGCGNGDSQTNGDCCQDPVAPENVGSTAVIAVVSPCQLVIANCGDSRAILCRGGKAIPLSNDHKPDREDEMGRIEAAGGRVIYWNGYRVGGFLAMSRALGDRFLKRYVISEPEVICMERTHEDECLILASDGLWDVLSNDTVCEVARKCLAGYRPHRSNGITEDTPVGAAAALLAKLALGRGSGDNVSVVVIDLKERRNRNR